MKTSHALILSILGGVAGLSAQEQIPLPPSLTGGGTVTPADIRVTKLQGQVWFGTANSVGNPALKSTGEIHDGYLRTGTDGTFYGNVGPGTNFRLGPGSEVQIQGVEKGVKPGGVKNPLEVTLTQGKLTTSTAKGANGYEVNVAGGRVVMPTALCVLCMHGDAAHVYVARGSAILYPLQGIYHNAGLQMLARPTIAVMSKRGVVLIQPLTSAAPGAVNCLLSGSSPEIAHALQENVPTPVPVPPPPNPPNVPVNPPVSATQ